VDRYENGRKNQLEIVTIKKPGPSFTRKKKPATQGQKEKNSAKSLLDSKIKEPFVKQTPISGAQITQDPRPKRTSKRHSLFNQRGEGTRVGEPKGTGGLVLPVKCVRRIHCRPTKDKSPVHAIRCVLPPGSQNLKRMSRALRKADMSVKIAKCREDHHRSARPPKILSGIWLDKNPYW